MIELMNDLPLRRPATTKASLAGSVEPVFNPVHFLNNRSSSLSIGSANNPFRNVSHDCHVFRSRNRGRKMFSSSIAFTISTVLAPTGVKRGSESLCERRSYYPAWFTLLMFLTGQSFSPVPADSGLGLHLYGQFLRAEGST